jgi:hypothetical protein
MPSGGHARSGIPPDPNALRRDRDKAEWRHLPASGREGPAPKWPLTRPTPREKALWAEEWARPQAIVWDENGQHREVALYVRAFAVAEEAGASVSARLLVMRQLDALGLTTSGLRANRWIIDAGQDQKVKRSDDPDRAGAKSRFKTIEGGAS